MANTLMHVKNIHWILVEDIDEIDLDVQALLQRSRIPFTYLAEKTNPAYPSSFPQHPSNSDSFSEKGWHQRNVALNYIREHVNTLMGRRGNGVLYFGDDDNTYDPRLFDNCIRKVKRVGMWAVGMHSSLLISSNFKGLVGGSLVESPRITNGRVVGFNVGWYPERKFAVDMAGFAINLEEILRYSNYPAN